MTSQGAFAVINMSNNDKSSNTHALHLVQLILGQQKIKPILV